MTSGSEQVQLSAERGHITLKTAREGMAGKAGHDLTIGVTRWSAELTTGQDGSPTSLEAHIDMGSLAVIAGTGGLKPLTDRDKREIAVTARKVLRADRSPEAVYAADGFEPDAAGGGVIRGTLTLAGTSNPLPLQVRRTGADSYQVTATVVQTQFGIKPYTGFLGALKVRDAVEVTAEITMPQPEAAG